MSKILVTLFLFDVSVIDIVSTVLSLLPHLNVAVVDAGVTLGSQPCTMGQNRKKHGINSHLIIHFPTSEGVSEVSERAND